MNPMTNQRRKRMRKNSTKMRARERMMKKLRL
jgi:hypothetical protein